MSVTEAMLDALTQRVAERIKRDLSIQWSPVLEELAHTREATDNMTAAFNQISRLLTEKTAALNDAVNGARRELAAIQLNNQHARELLLKARRELGLTE